MSKKKPTEKPTIAPAPDKPTFNTTSTATPTTKPLPSNPKYDTTSWDDTEKGQAAGGAYNTAKENVNNFEDFTYDDYSESDAVKNAGSALNSHNANKPGEYQSQWQGKIDELMNSILNREKFSYDLNGDALYQQYKDKYVQQGKLAMGDAIGQASAMTGGYGNSYAQSVGQQQYQASLDNLNDIVPQLYQMALDKYNMEGQDLYNQYGMVADRENLDYSRYRDTVSDWYVDRDYLTGRYDTERGFDYNKYIDDKNFAYGLHQDEYQRLLDYLGIAKSDYYDGANMFHTEQSTKNSVASQMFNDAMSKWTAENGEAWKQYQAAEDARQYANTLLQQGYQNEFNAWDANTQNAWESAKWDESLRKYENEEEWRQKQWDRDETWHNESKTVSGGNGGNGGNGSGNSSGATFTNTLWNETGVPQANGTRQFINSEGKTVTLGEGINPYTHTKHPDLKHGACSNGYQPDNIGGNKLEKAKHNGVTITTNITGKKQNVWTVGGKYYLWRGDLNEYIEVDISDIIG